MVGKYLLFFFLERAYVYVFFKDFFFKIKLVTSSLVEVKNSLEIIDEVWRNPIYSGCPERVDLFLGLYCTPPPFFRLPITSALLHIVLELAYEHIFFLKHVYKTGQ
jgi:hypothetical protein